MVLNNFLSVGNHMQTLEPSASDNYYTTNLNMNPS